MIIWSVWTAKDSLTTVAPCLFVAPFVLSTAVAKTPRRKQMASIRKTSIQQAVKGPTFIEDFLRYLRGMPVVLGD